ncbi:hypothetical protein XELAEV_18026302mg [Xenopus laevis]|uniref:Uncharacterized protein n=1 Tax=Xenopus laevis TaxID=8355 RepID=A0A974CU34_XENLA|nr:hypothetical protein XELAEV_18026302mg [Xenopus laevis]
MFSPIGIFCFPFALYYVYWHLKKKSKKLDSPARIDTQSKEEQRPVKGQKYGNEKKKHKYRKKVHRKVCFNGIGRYSSPKREQVCDVNRGQASRKKPMTKSRLEAPVPAVPNHKQTAPPAMASKKYIKGNKKNHLYVKFRKYLSICFPTLF